MYTHECSSVTSKAGVFIKYPYYSPLLFRFNYLFVTRIKTDAQAWNEMYSRPIPHVTIDIAYTFTSYTFTSYTHTHIWKRERESEIDAFLNIIQTLEESNFAEIPVAL